MWVCAYCEAINSEEDLVCVCCGLDKKVRPPEKRKAEPKSTPKPKSAPKPTPTPTPKSEPKAAPTGVIKGPSAGSSPKSTEGTGTASVSHTAKPEKKSGKGVATFLVLAAVLLFCYYNIHIWTPASCSKPETCSICGKTRGSPLEHQWIAASCTEPKTCAECGKTEGIALGHIWRDATCTEPKKCIRCGKTSGIALGHIWMDATYDAPKSCLRCGATSGDPKGFIGTPSGYTSSEPEYLRNNQSFYPYYLYSPVENCFRLTMDFHINSYDGNPFGEWYLYIRELNGKWSHVALFDLKTSYVDKTITVNFSFDQPVSFDAIAVLKRGNDAFSINYHVEYYDVQHYVD